MALGLLVMDNWVSILVAKTVLPLLLSFVFQILQKLQRCLTLAAITLLVLVVSIFICFLFGMVKCLQVQVTLASGHY
jgi:hypothetical protein